MYRSVVVSRSRAGPDLMSMGNRETEYYMPDTKFELI